ncbi:hypothetical protein QTO34_001596 [Cnephaeus nilssonii]|uniref:Uncharacterized protein n=1 Tax=Cnephaeus nilssonii TaxID=3371016 RepID=A0AA40HW63_CNENI|nr:hypothetical protein QTO34_001596 [Eptesicus nilssonii]
MYGVDVIMGNTWLSFPFAPDFLFRQPVACGVHEAVGHGLWREHGQEQSQRDQRDKSESEQTTTQAYPNSPSQPKENSLGQNRHREETIHQLAMQLKNIGDSVDRWMAQEGRSGQQLLLASIDGAGPTRTCCWHQPQSLCSVSRCEWDGAVSMWE